MMAIIAKTINGEIQEFPPTYYFPCSQVQAEGESVVREYDLNSCIVATRVFLVKYGGNTFGTKQFTSRSEFLKFQIEYCSICCGGGACDIIIDGCALMYNGCDIKYSFN